MDGEDVCKVKFVGWTEVKVTVLNTVVLGAELSCCSLWLIVPLVLLSLSVWLTFLV